MGVLAFVAWWFRLDDDDDLWDHEIELDPPIAARESLLKLIYSDRWDHEFVDTLGASWLE